MKPVHKKELKRILDTYDDKIKEAEIRALVRWSRGLCRDKESASQQH